MQSRNPDGALDAARFLVSSRGCDALAAARALRGQEPLARRKALDRIGTPAEVRAALSQDDLRARAAIKSHDAESLLFTRTALEQATPEVVARERAGRFVAFSTVADLGAGIGLDAIALARAGRRVVAVEKDPVRALFLAHNVKAAGFAEAIEVVEGDFLSSPPTAVAAFLDPDRRPGGKKTRDASRFEPPESSWAELALRYRHLLVKLPPATRPPDAYVTDQSGGLEWVSLEGEMKEARRGFGDLELRAPRRVLLLPSGATLEGEGKPWPSPRAPRVGDLLLDPDPAVVLAGLVGEAALEVGAVPVHPRIAYLVGDRTAPWAKAVRVEEVVGTSSRDLQAALDRRGAGRVEIRTRGIEDPPDVWRRKLAPRGDASVVLVLTRGPDDRYLGVLGTGVTGGGAPCIP